MKPQDAKAAKELVQCSLHLLEAVDAIYQCHPMLEIPKPYQENVLGSIEQILEMLSGLLQELSSLAEENGSNYGNQFIDGEPVSHQEAWQKLPDFVVACRDRLERSVDNFESQPFLLMSVRANTFRRILP